jgi:hypothetical protein
MQFWFRQFTLACKKNVTYHKVKRGNVYEPKPLNEPLFIYIYIYSMTTKHCHINFVKLFARYIKSLLYFFLWSLLLYFPNLQGCSVSNFFLGFFLY